ncbi:MAG: hypothetical protein WCO44_12775 [Bacteroidota bacterium]
MKTTRDKSASDSMDNRMRISNHRIMVPHTKLLSGSVEGKFPVTLDDGKTIIFISDKSQETETRRRYELRLANIYNQFGKKTKA